MSTPKTPVQRSAKRRQRERLAGITRMTLSLGRETAQALRALAKEHGKTQAEVLQLGVLMAHKALAGLKSGPAAHGTSPAPSRPAAALADLQAQMAELRATQEQDDDAVPPMRAAERRAIELGLAGEVRQ